VHAAGADAAGARCGAEPDHPARWGAGWPLVWYLWQARPDRLYWKIVVSYTPAGETKKRSPKRARNTMAKAR